MGSALTPLGRLALAPDGVVAIRDGERLSRARLLAKIGGTAAALAGCRRGLLCCRDGWSFVVGLFGLLAAGAEVLLPPNDSPETLARLAGEADRVVDDAFAAEPRPWAGELGEGKVVFHTSGSSGVPKRVVRSLDSLDAEIAALEALWGERLAGAAALATVPHHHAFGLVFKLLWPLAAGRPFFSRQYDLWEEVLAELPAGAVLVSSPAHLTRMGGLAPLAPARRPRLVLSAGAPLPDAAAAEVLRLFGVPVGEIYGSTETGAIAARLHERAAPAWVPLPGYRVEAGGEGMLRLTAQGATVELPDRIRVEQGGFHLLGRADRIAKIEGKRVALDEVERALAALPEIVAARALVVEGGVLAAVAVPSVAGAAALAQQGAFRWTRALRRALLSHLEPAAVPRRWRFVSALPAAAMGKHRLADLAALFEGEKA